MPTQIRLDEALDQILGVAVQRCRDATGSGQLLEGITKVVSGERARPRPEPPYLWLVTGAGNMQEQRQAIMETWTVSLLLSAFVLSEEPEDGWQDAIRFATRARSSVLKPGRTLGLGFVQDSRSAEFGPLGKFSQGRRFGGFARIDVTTNVLEV